MSYGLDPRQFVRFVIRPTLERLMLWSPAAEILLLGTALTESNLRWLSQVPNGPAMGPFEMEPATHFDCWDNWLRFPVQLFVRGAVQRMTTYYSGDYPDPAEMRTNLMYACAMARVRYRRARPALPPANDAHALAAYHKRHYNTASGKTRVEESIKHFEFAIQLGDTKS